MSLNVGKGEVVALLGRNGMGKSTTSEKHHGPLTPRSGKVVFEGRDITGLRPFKVARAGIGYVPGGSPHLPNLTVLDNLMMGVKGGDG
jgi:branched-chain amino acid transport system ATP-binding protein